MNKRLIASLCVATLLAACGSQTPTPAPEPTAVERGEPAESDRAVTGPQAIEPGEPERIGDRLLSTPIASFAQPWAMSFLPDGRLLVTERRGTLKLVDLDRGAIGEIVGVPDVIHAGQGGLGDVLPHPKFSENHLLYFSYAEDGDMGTSGAVVARATLVLDDAGGGELQEPAVVWRQLPKVEGHGHYGHRIAFGSDGMLWITAGERQQFDPAQDMEGSLGKIIRLHDDGSAPADNPFYDRRGTTAEIWSLGHRNPLGIAFDADGRLWVHEMGPRHGDELNLIKRGRNYGYPIVSNGDHYDGTPIPDHHTRPEFEPPVISWVPAISPAGFIIYSGDRFPDWRGNGFIGGLSSRALVRIEFDGDDAREVERFDMGARIREIEQGPDGTIWLLEDERDDSRGRLLRLDPVEPTPES